MNVVFGPDGSAIVSDAEAFISVYEPDSGHCGATILGSADIEEIVG